MNFSIFLKEVVMPSVTVNNETKNYKKGTEYSVIANDFKDMYADDIILARVNGKLRELNKKLNGACTISFVTVRDDAGRKTYERSAVFILLKAFKDTAPEECIHLDYSIGGGIYGEIKGKTDVSDKLLGEVKKRMREIVDEKIPIKKTSMNTAEAVEYFAGIGMHDKEQLLSYRRASRVNIYSLGDYSDYFYGYMAPDAGYIKYFDLVKYHDSFLLELPSASSSGTVNHVSDMPKLYTVLKEAYSFSDTLEVPNVGALNKMICDGNAKDLIMMNEAFQEKEIGKIAEMALKNSEGRIVLIAGPSSSGKTTFCHRLAIQFRALGYTPHPVSVDNYFRNRSEYPVDEFGNIDKESIECVDTEKLNEDIGKLLKGEKVEMPAFNFQTGEREYHGDFLQFGEKDILLMEGIHCLNDDLTYSLPHDQKFRIYISALTQLNIDDHNRIPTTDGRLIRRMVRDARTRGTAARETLATWDSVRRGEEQNIFPFQEDADVMFNSALVYEFAVLKLYAEPMLFAIPHDCEEYEEAKRLLKFFDYFIGLDSEYVPRTSLLREFIGGSWINV